MNKEELIYLDSYLIQQDMRIRLPKSILENLQLQKGVSKLHIYLDKDNERIILKKEKDVQQLSMSLPCDTLKSDKVIRFVDLFAGIGGIRLGFEQAFNERGYKTECVLTSEIKPYAVEALKDNFTQDELLGDIHNIKSEDIKDFDFLLAGFPCQAFSMAGKGLGFLDTRGTLFFEVERILKEKKPYGFILENVEGLVLHDREKSSDPIGRTLKTILMSLENLGYKVQWRLLECQKFGVPQMRKRIFIVGTLDTKVDLDNFEPINAVVGDILEHNKPTVKSHFTKCLLQHYSPKELYGKAIKDKRGGENNIHSWDIGLKGEITKEQKLLIEKLFKERRKRHWAEEIGIKWMDGMPLTETQIKTFYDTFDLHNILEHLTEMGYLSFEHPKKQVKGKDGTLKRIPDETKPKGYNIVAGKLSFEFSKILNPNDIAPTLVAMDVAKLGVVDGQGVRRLTIRECQRLCGYPDDYTLDMLNEEDAFDLLGNTVCVPVIKDIALRLGKNYLKN